MTLTFASPFFSAVSRMNCVCASEFEKPVTVELGNRSARKSTAEPQPQLCVVCVSQQQSCLAGVKNANFSLDSNRLDTLHGTKVYDLTQDP